MIAVDKLFDPKAAQKMISDAALHDAPMKRRKVTALPTINTRREGPPVAFAYGRVSSFSQYEKDNSIPDQKVRAKRYYEMYLKDNGVVWGDFHEDGKGMSASKTPFVDRPAGRRLVNQLRPGDHLIIDKIDRMWRKVSDFCRMTDWFAENRITLHIVNMNGVSLNSDTPMGKVILTMIASFAEAEATMLSQRIRDGLSSKKMNGEPTQLMQGTMSIKKNNREYVVWDIEKRKIMKEVVRLHDDEHYTFVEIAIEMENRRRVEAGLSKMTPILKKMWITQPRKMMWVRPYWIEKGIKILGITDPSQLPRYSNLFSVAKKFNAETMPDWENVRLSKLAGRKSMIS